MHGDFYIVIIQINLAIILPSSIVGKAVIMEQVESMTLLEEIKPQKCVRDIQPNLCGH